MEPRHHGADRATHEIGYLTVGKLLHVGEHDDHPELLRHLIEGADDFALNDRTKSLPLRIAHRAQCVRTDPTVRQRIRVRTFQYRSFEPAPSVTIDERIFEDLEEPGLEVRAAFVLFPCPKRLHEGVL